MYSLLTPGVDILFGMLEAFCSMATAGILYVYTALKLM